MDLFNKDALLKMTRRAEEAENLAKALKKENEELKSRICGDRVCDGYCNICNHGIKKQSFSPIDGLCDTWICELNCKCKDFEKKHE